MAEASLWDLLIYTVGEGGKGPFMVHALTPLGLKSLRGARPYLGEADTTLQLSEWEAEETFGSFDEAGARTLTLA